MISEAKLGNACLNSLILIVKIIPVLCSLDFIAFIFLKGWFDSRQHFQQYFQYFLEIFLLRFYRYHPPSFTMNYVPRFPIFLTEQFFVCLFIIDKKYMNKKSLRPFDPILAFELRLLEKHNFYFYFFFISTKNYFNFLGIGHGSVTNKN